MVDIVELVTYQREYDLIGSPHEVEVKRKTYCEVSNITQTEFYRAKEQKIGIKYCLILNAFDYHGESHAIFKGEKLKVVRTYTTGERLELYLGS